MGDWIINNSEFINIYAYVAGLHAPFTNSTSTDREITVMFAQAEGFKKSQIYTVLENSQNDVQLFGYIQKLFWSFEKWGITYPRRIPSKQIERFVQGLRDAIDITPGTNVNIKVRGTEITLYPGGAKTLDIKLVDDNLEWLEEYPTVLKPFLKSLELFQTNDQNNYRNLLDNLRLAVEELLRKILNNRKSLDNQKPDLGQWLESKGVTSQIRNMYIQFLFGYFVTYQNEMVKHHDRSNIVEVEYLIYLTGTFIRFLLQLNQTESSFG